MKHVRNCRCETCQEEELRQGLLKSIKGIPTKGDLEEWWNAA